MGFRVIAEAALAVSQNCKSQPEHVHNQKEHGQRYKDMLLYNHGAHPLIAATIQATPLMTPKIQAPIPKVLASVGTVSNRAAIATIDPRVQATAASML